MKSDFNSEIESALDEILNEEEFDWARFLKLYADLDLEEDFALEDDSSAGTDAAMKASMKADMLTDLTDDLMEGSATESLTRTPTQDELTEMRALIDELKNVFDELDATVATKIVRLDAIDSRVLQLQTSLSMDKASVEQNNLSEMAEMTEESEASAESSTLVEAKIKRSINNAMELGAARSEESEPMMAKDTVVLNLSLIHI